MTIQLPDFEKAFEYENYYYLSSGITRMRKLIAHYEFYKMAAKIPGDIVECGVFKGASFMRWAKFREIFGQTDERSIIGFDTFGTFPETEFAADQEKRAEFIRKAGSESISAEQLHRVLDRLGLDRKIDLVEGNILQVMPDYLKARPDLKIALLLIDVDTYEAAKCSLESLYPFVVQGGIIVFDDYGVFPGTTKAVDDFMRETNHVISKLAVSEKTNFIRKV
ncbi:TylF/MycF family methyltransferase [Omnitrophica bacterium]|nr:TylF/MycF family methyltransferase [Candidatus Omnitrophota bacterium]